MQDSRPAYAVALDALANHDATHPFIVFLDNGDTIKAIAAANGSFVAMCTTSLLQELVENAPTNKVVTTATSHLLLHSGLSRWQVFKIGVYTLFSKDCEHMKTSKVEL